jgi:phage major head subunit gpT-like protein
MAGTRTSDIDALIVAGIDMIFNRNLQNETRMYYPEICREVTQPKPTGIYQTVGALGGAYVKPEGDSFTYESIRDYNQTTITSQTIGKGVAASFEALTNDQYGVTQQTFGAPLTTTLVKKRERYVADAYNHAFATTGADGVYQLSASHPLENSASLNDNLATGAITVENIKTALNKFNFIYDMAGEFFDTSATHLLIHPNKLFTVKELLESQLLAFELSNTKNSLMDTPLRIVVDKYLDYTVATGVSPWFLLDRTITDAGVFFQRQTAPKMDLWWNEDTLEYRGACYERYGVGIVAPGYGIIGSLGT